MSLMLRRRALMGALSEAQKILPGTVIWENKVTGTDGITILCYGDSHEYPMEAYDICVYTQQLSTSDSGACVIGLSSPFDFSLCTVLKCEYRLVIRADYSGARVRFGLGKMPATAAEFYSNPTGYIPDESGFETAVPSGSAVTKTQTIEIPGGIGVKVPMVTIRTAGRYTGGYVQPIKIWVE